MKLLTSYALSTGSKIGKPFVFRSYYPLPFEKYVTIHASSGMNSKNYSYWQEVIDLLKPFLDKNGYKLVQIGMKKDPQIKHCHNLLGKSNIHQSCYILENSSLHLGNDSFSAHVCGAFEVPLVAVYGATTVKNHGPYFVNEDKARLIESDRDGNLPTFAKEESPKMVDLIKPEQIVQAALDLLGLDSSEFKHESMVFGPSYSGDVTVEFVPDHILPKEYLSGGLINIRMDYNFDEKIMASTASQREVHVISDKPINTHYLRVFRHNIKKLSLEVTLETELGYLEEVSSTGVPIELITKEKDKEKLSALRFKFFDYSILEDTEFSKEKLDLKEESCYNVFYKANKFILSNGKIFLSRADMIAGNSIENFNSNVKPIIDEEEFWKESNYFYLFRK